MSVRSFLICFCLVATLLQTSCGDKEIFEPAGAAEYLINNQTSDELRVTFITSQELGLMTTDDLDEIAVGQSLLVHTDGIIGVNPQPTDSFSQITITRANDTQQSFTLSPIDNQLWEVLERNLGDTGYGLTIYQLTVTDEDF